MPQSWIGAGKNELDTPVLCVDLPVFEQNLQTLAGIVRGGGKGWRPHCKGHKSPVVAYRELAAGAHGITCAKIGEAEVLAAAGIRDLLIANVIAGPQKCRRLAALCKMANPIICCDHYAQAEPIAAACRELGVTCRVLVDINIGMNRTGIRPGRDAIELAQGIDSLDGVELVGVMGYEGHLMQVADRAAKAQQIRDSLSLLDQSREAFLKAGLRCDIVSAGGSGSAHVAATCPGITEIQAGGGIFGDPFYTVNCGATVFEPALTILATVISRPTLDRAVLDAGRKTVNPDLHPPLVKGFPDATILFLSAEHCTMELGPVSQRLRIGDRIELIVGYHDFTTALHDEFYAFRGDRLEAVWPVAARGRLQ